MYFRALTGVCTILALLVLSGCGQNASKTMEPAAVTLRANVIEAVSQRRIVFAHQSVGNDVLKGVAQLTSAADRPLQIVETRAVSADHTGIFHFKVGVNGAPQSKLRDFEIALDESPTKPDIALIKLCYIDFNDSTDGAALAHAYVATLERLSAAHPATRFVAVTAPLTTIQTGPKAWIKRFLGKQPAGYVVNARRADFNALLRKRFATTGLFDIAAIESNATIDVEGRQVQILDPTLTYDGGHLNAAGQQKVAAALLDFLARTTR